MNFIWQKFTAKVPSSVANVVAIGLSLFAGVLFAMVVHYVLYRIALPSKPFIYVAF